MLARQEQRKALLLAAALADMRKMAERSEKRTLCKIFHLQLNATVVSPLRGLLLLHSRTHFLRFQAQSSHAPESRQGRLQTEHVSIYI